MYNSQLEEFVHAWFSDLDQLKESKVFLERLHEDFEFNIYGTKLYGHKGFLSIYRGMQAQSDTQAKHIASNVVVEQVTETLYQINFDIALEHSLDGGMTSRSESVEEWLIKVDAGRSIIMKYAII
ncbi:hypothetical protein EYV94_14590 [Puteibacter caeruleilacunae]|nr:hypothetical protein EYV94_14590 [Puteibacter caeruleilacunae]